MAFSFPLFFFWVRSEEFVERCVKSIGWSGGGMKRWISKFVGEEGRKAVCSFVLSLECLTMEVHKSLLIP